MHICILRIHKIYFVTYFISKDEYIWAKNEQKMSNYVKNRNITHILLIFNPSLVYLERKMYVTIIFIYDIYLHFVS